MTELQRPAVVYMGGRLVPWETATIHVAAEGLIRGLSVFEGIKGYWDDETRHFAFLALREHYERLGRSARMLHLPFDLSYDSFADAVTTLAQALLVAEKDLWVRPTLVALEGHWGVGTVSDLIITGYHQDKQRPGLLDVGVSTWQRPADAAMPARIKSAANYQVGRLARIEGTLRGLDDMILLNSAGRIAEASGSCVLVVRRGVVATPPWSEGCLESITVDIVEEICGNLGIQFVRRPIDRSELYVADELGLVGTLMELGRVRRVDDFRLPDQAPTFTAIADAFWAGVREGQGGVARRLTRIATRAGLLTT